MTTRNSMRRSGVTPAQGVEPYEGPLARDLGRGHYHGRREAPATTAESLWVLLARTGKACELNRNAPTETQPLGQRASTPSD
jgi:hypothetical protein